MSMQNFGGVKEVHYGIVQVVNRGLPELDLARGRDFQCWPKGSRPLGTRMYAVSVCIYGMLWRMPEMVAPRALFFRPLVKGNEALGTRLITTVRKYICMTYNTIRNKVSFLRSYLSYKYAFYFTQLRIIHNFNNESRNWTQKVWGSFVRANLVENQKISLFV